MITTPKPCNLAEREHYNSKVTICVKLRTQWNLLWCPHHQAAAVSDNEKPDSHLRASIKYTWSRSDGGFPRVAACYKDPPFGSSAAFDHISSHLIAARFKIKPCISSLSPTDGLLRSIEFWPHCSLGWHSNYSRKTRFGCCTTYQNTQL